jgi:hypothetical protein
LGWAGLGDLLLLDYLLLLLAEFLEELFRGLNAGGLLGRLDGLGGVGWGIGLAFGLVLILVVGVLVGGVAGVGGFVRSRVLLLDLERGRNLDGLLELLRLLLGGVGLARGWTLTAGRK